MTYPPRAETNTMFLRRKIGTGATSRRRPSRECRLGVEGLDTRAVPTVVIPAPGTSLAPFAGPLQVAFDEYGHGFARSGFFGQAGPLPTNLVAGAPTAVPGVTGDGTTNPLTLAYRLPAAVQPGDVAVLSLTGETSDVIRFWDTVDLVNGITGWMLVYSDAGPADPADSPADTGLPANFNLFSPFTQIATEFGVEGFEVVQYAADGGSLYTGLSDGNLLPFGGA